MHFDDKFLEGSRRKTLEKASILKSCAVFSAVVFLEITASTKDSKIIYICATYCPSSHTHIRVFTCQAWFKIDIRGELRGLWLTYLNTTEFLLHVKRSFIRSYLPLEGSLHT